ncbi:MAG: cytochrome C oxidase subunit IV family protein [Acidimicrobiia bacterium]
MSEIETQHSHRSPAQYVLIAVILCVLTAMEISLYYLESSINTTLLVVCLLTLAAIKFGLVAAFFMHLKDDPKIFRRWFIVGGIGALIVFTVALTALRIQDHRFF